ncbi:hypothetical protein ScPMuIL_002491 [Solemya velum]
MSLTQQKIQEMEAEMSRFEQEIAPFPEEGAVVHIRNRMIIGAQTFDKVQAQLSGRGDDEDDEEGDEDPPETEAPISIPLSVLAAPPPPPPSLTNIERPQIPLLPPPPPPPVLKAPSFVPPQLRDRGGGLPQPRPPPLYGQQRPPMQMHYQGPPMPHHMQGPDPRGFHPRPMMGMMHRQPMPYGPGPGPNQGNMMPYRPSHISNDSKPMYGVSRGDGNSGSSEDKITNSSIISKPKVIYSAAPVKIKQSSETKTETVKPDIAPTVMAPVAPPTVETPESKVDLEEYLIADDIDVEQMSGGKKEKKEKKKKFLRTAAGQTWEDPTLAEWDNDDFRMFCGDLGNEVTDEILGRVFIRYPSFVKAKIVRDKKTNKTKGYGFVSFRDPNDFARAMREMNGKYVGNRPIKLRKSTWKDRSIDVVRKKEKEKKRLGLR